jgi:hypothetical protein
MSEFSQECVCDECSKVNICEDTCKRYFKWLLEEDLEGNIPDWMKEANIEQLEYEIDC